MIIHIQYYMHVAVVNILSDTADVIFLDTPIVTLTRYLLLPWILAEHKVYKNDWYFNSSNNKMITPVVINQYIAKVRPWSN